MTRTQNNTQEDKEKRLDDGSVRIQIKDGSQTDSQDNTGTSGDKKRTRTSLQRHIFTLATCFIAFIVVPFAGYAIQINIKANESKASDFLFPHFSQFWITALSALFFHVCKRQVKLFRPLTLRAVETHSEDGKLMTEQERQDLAKKIEEHSYGLVFYTVSTVVVFQLCINQDWMPLYLGGSGKLENSFVNMPFAKVDPALLTYGLINFGSKLESLIDHVLFQKRGKDFEEMLLHDIVTIFLCFSYISSNIIAAGTLILLIHDISDSIMHLAKALNYSSFKVFAAPTFLMGQLWWAYFRLYCFPQIIYQISQASFPTHLAHFQPLFILGVIFLATLLALHFIWFLLFQRVNYRILTKKSVKEEDMTCEGTDGDQIDETPSTCSSSESK